MVPLGTCVTHLLVLSAMGTFKLHFVIRLVFVPSCLSHVISVFVFSPTFENFIYLCLLKPLSGYTDIVVIITIISNLCSFKNILDPQYNKSQNPGHIGNHF